MKKAMDNNKGAVMIWVLCLSIVIFVIGISVLTAASMSSGAALRYRDARSCYFYSKTLSEAITSSVTEFSIADNDPWCKIAQSLYDVKITDREKTAIISNPDLNIDIPPGIEGQGFDDNSATITITLENQTMNIMVPYKAPVEAFGSPGDLDYIPYQAEQLEKTRISFDLIIELRTGINNQEYLVYLKYQFEGETQGVEDMGAGNGVISKGKYQYIGCFDSI